MTLMQLRACALGHTGLTAAQIAQRFGAKNKKTIKQRRQRARKRLRKIGLDLPAVTKPSSRHVRAVDVNQLDQAA